MASRSAMSREPLGPVPPDVPDELSLGQVPADLRGVELEVCLLERIDLSERDASRVRMTESRLERGNLSGCSLKSAAFRNVLIADGSWANVRAESVSLSRVQFERLRMTGADLTSALIRDALFTDCRLDLSVFRFAKLERVRFERCQMGEVDFYGSQLTSVVFVDCDLVSATWSGAVLTRSEIRGCDLAGARSPERLRGVRMPWPDVINAADELAAALGIEVIER
jgi:uncharacterized protein YjbI with pentapeptide repeats